jgi:hypothetical protein
MPSPARIPRNLDHLEGYLNGFNAARKMLAAKEDAQAHFDMVCALARGMRDKGATRAPKPRRLHRLEADYPDLWRAIDGAIRAAQHAHPDIQISDRRRSSVVKRAVGQALAAKARSGRPDETGVHGLRNAATSEDVSVGQPPAVERQTAGGA